LLAFLLIAECALLLASALQRLLAYQSAYGYTTARLDVAIYIAAAAAALVLLAWEVWRGIDIARLAWGVMATGVVAACIPMYGNSAAYVVRQNLERYRQTGLIDANYLAYSLSVDAIPETLRALPQLPPEARSTIEAGLAVDYRGPDCETASDGRWFEWNLRRTQACAALQAHWPDGRPPQPSPEPASPSPATLQPGPHAS
jgi:hypothetical protein